MEPLNTHLANNKIKNNRPSMIEFPQVIFMEDLYESGMNFQDWTDKNGALMDELVLAGSYLMMGGEYDSVTLVEIWSDDEIWSTVDLNYSDIIEALEHNEEHWVSREDYERAAESRDLIEIFKNK